MLQKAGHNRMRMMRNRKYINQVFGTLNVFLCFISFYIIIIIIIKKISRFFYNAHTHTYKYNKQYELS